MDWQTDGYPDPKIGTPGLPGSDKKFPNKVKENLKTFSYWTEQRFVEKEIFAELYHCQMAYWEWGNPKVAEEPNQGGDVTNHLRFDTACQYTFLNI